MLLMRIMIMEYNQLLFPGRFRLQWGMREALTALGLGLGLGLGFALTLPKPKPNPNQALTALRSLELTPPPSKSNPTDFNAFHHSFYLATHIVYVQSAYNAIKADQVRVRVRVSPNLSLTLSLSLSLTLSLTVSLTLPVIVTQP